MAIGLLACWMGALAQMPEPAPMRSRLQQVDEAFIRESAQALATLQALLPQLPAEGPDRVHALGLLARSQVRQAPAEALAQTLDALQAQQRQVPWASAAVALAKAVSLQIKGDLAQSQMLSRQALTEHGAQLPAWLAWRLMMVQGSSLIFMNRTPEAVSVFQQAQPVADQLSTAAGARNLLFHAQLLIDAKMTAEGGKLVRQALDRAQASGDDDAMSMALSLMALLDNLAHDAPARLAHMEQALHHARRGGVAMHIAGCLANLNSGYRTLGRWQDALPLSREALALARTPYDLSLAHINHGQTLLGMHQLKAGLDHLNQGLSLAAKASPVTVRAEYLLGSIDALEAAGYPQQALAYLPAWRKLAADSAIEAESAAVGELQEAHDAQQRERDLDLLQRDGALQQAELARRALWQRARLVGLALALTVLAAGSWLLMRLRSQNRLLRATNDMLKFHSEHDALTGLGNRRSLGGWLQGLTAKDWHGGLMVAIIDLDHFKHINDRHGHATGDAVLRTVAQRLQQHLPVDGHLVRWGGEEFLLLAPAADAPAAAWLASQVLHAIGAQPIVPSSGQAPVRVTASIGWGWVQPAQLQPGPLLQDVLPQVDQALYVAKSHGRNRAVAAMI